MPMIKPQATLNTYNVITEYNTWYIMAYINIGVL